MSDHALPAHPTPARHSLTVTYQDSPTGTSPDLAAHWIAFAHEILAMLEGAKWAGCYRTPPSTIDEPPAGSSDANAVPRDDSNSDSYQSDTDDFANPWDAQAAQVEAQFKEAMTKILPQSKKVQTRPWRPRPATLLAALKIAKTFGSAEEMCVALTAEPGLTLIPTAQTSLVQTALKILAAIVATRLISSSTAERIEVLLAEATAREGGQDFRTPFPGLADYAAEAIERAQTLVFVTSVASTAPKALRDLRPNVIPLVPLDHKMLCILLHLAYPDRDLASAIADLPDHLPFARLSASTLTLALRSADPDVAIRAIASALSPAPPHSRSLADFPLPQTARRAVDQLIADLRDWQAGAVHWRDIPRGLLLSGPPGCGKTELARLIGQEAGIAVVHGSLAQWSAQSTRSGDAIKSMRAAFTSAAELAPSVLFIDEIDAFGNRARPQDHNSAYTDYIVTALLDLLDGFQSLEGVIIVGATNHPARLDAAITRRGRFDLSLTLAHPDIDQLPQALRWHLSDDLAQADLTAVAQAAIGLSGADIAAAVRAARSRARAARRSLTPEDLTAVISDIHPPLPQSLQKRVAYHEAGHAIASVATGRARPDRLVLCSAGGFMQSCRDAEATDRAAIEADLTIALAGRAAETLIYGSPASGSGGDAQSDLARATVLATALEASLGLGASLIWHGPMETCLAQLHHNARLGRRVEAHLQRAQEHAMQILTVNRCSLDELACALGTARVLEGPALQDHLDGVLPAMTDAKQTARIPSDAPDKPDKPAVPAQDPPQPATRPALDDCEQPPDRPR